MSSRGHYASFSLKHGDSGPASFSSEHGNGGPTGFSLFPDFCAESNTSSCKNNVNLDIVAK
jgi:hypothetical protein